MLGWRHLTPGVCGRRMRQATFLACVRELGETGSSLKPAGCDDTTGNHPNHFPALNSRTEQTGRGLGRHKAGQQASGRVAAERHTSSNFLMSPSAGPAGPESLESASLGGRDLGGPVLGAGKPLTFLRNTLPKPSTLNPKPLNLKPLTLGPGCSVAASVGSASSGAPRGQRSSSSTEFRAS